MQRNRIKGHFASKLKGLICLLVLSTIVHSVRTFDSWVKGDVGSL